MQKSIFGILAALLFVACSSDDNYTGRTFIPDMQYSPAYEPYAEATEEYYEEVVVQGEDTILVKKRRSAGTTALKPVANTVARGEKLYHLENTQEGYDASASVMNPIEKTEKVLAHGKELYETYCMICHGKKGDGNGSLPVSEVYPVQPPSYIDGPKVDLAEGTIFHVITHGKGMMGSHAGQLNWDERWKIVHYIQSLKEKAAK